MEKTEMAVVRSSTRVDGLGGPIGREDALLIAHRGASGYCPENTIRAFALAITLGADCLELDVVPTQDGQLVVRHESELSKTTNVASHLEFADRRATKVIDGKTRSGWFTEDFTLAELKVLRARERMRRVRPGNSKLDGLYPVPTLAEVVDLASRSQTSTHRPVKIFIETKHSHYFRSVGLPLEEEVLSLLQAKGYDSADAPVFLASSETANLKRLAQLTDIPLVQLVRCSGGPKDLSARSYTDLVSRGGLRGIRRYAGTIGLCKDLAIPRDSEGRLERETSVIDDAHRSGLTVLGWTFRRENRFLPAQFRLGTDPHAYGDLAQELARFASAGMDGFILDHPDVSRPALAPLRLPGRPTQAAVALVKRWVWRAT